MRLLSPNKGATHGWVNEGYWVRYAVGHGKLESTVRYLGIEVDDALEIGEQLRCSSGELVAAAELDGR